MKKIYRIGIILSIFIFYGCSINNFNVSDLDQSTIVVSSNNINSTVKENIIQSSKEDITIVLENKTEYQYFYGANFRLEVKLNDNWYEVPYSQNPEFLEIAIILNGYSKNEEVIQLANYFNDLPDGEYRIVKSLYHNSEEIIVIAPFEVKNN